MRPVWHRIHDFCHGWGYYSPGVKEVVGRVEAADPTFSADVVREEGARYFYDGEVERFLGASVVATLPAASPELVEAAYSNLQIFLERHRREHPPMPAGSVRYERVTLPAGRRLPASTSLREALAAHPLRSPSEQGTT